MAKIVKLHHNIDLTKEIMEKLMWGGNALQTVSITRRTPFNPQQAVGFKGIVDYATSPVTSEVTLDTILTENCNDATGNSVYDFAENEVKVGQESYVLTSCNVNFQAGNPATVNYGYITAGLASHFDTTLNPTLLTKGEVAAFAVVLGEDGSGVNVISIKDNGDEDSSNSTALPAGIQTLGFSSSLNRNQILDVRKSSPVQFVTTYPLDISMNIEALQMVNAAGLFGVKVLPGYASIVNASKALGSKSFDESSLSGSLAALYCKATGLKNTENGESINVGGNLTYTYQFTAADLEIPLTYVEDSNS